MNSNLKTLRRSALGLLAATLLAGALTAASALADEQVRSEAVRFDDLDASTLTGAHALYGRIHAAVQRVCFERDRRGVQACETLSERRAVEQLNLPLVTAYYQQSAAAGRRR
jgi:UrcA family protein